MRRVPFTVYHRSNSVLRINTIGQLSEGAENNTSAGDYVLVSNLESFWDTTVTLTDSAPLDCFIALQSIKLQYRMEFNGLLFHLSFSGPNHALPRISATLASPSESHSANAVELYNSMIRMLAYDDVLEAHVEQFKHMNFASADD